MTSPENPFDQTVWDPIDTEQAIEDHMHGSEAVIGLLSTPPMRKTDGTYHVFGGYYTCGTNTFDAQGKPFIRFGGPASTMDMMRESFDMQEWVEKHHNGELPSPEEMDYPEFDLAATPYLVAPTVD